MTAENPTLRETLNNGVLQRLADVNRDALFGDLLNMFVAAATPTQVGIVPVTTPANFDTATLANQADALYLINATAGAFTGIMTLIIDPRTTRIPKSGEAVWDGKGSTLIRLNNGDAITALSVLYSRTDGANRSTSLFERVLGQTD